ncbi:MAG: S8 family serine peptidase [Bacteroidales bacterium]|nr:S8 family serine peptidase [Bacteroidales bacterium]
MATNKILIIFFLIAFSTFQAFSQQPTAPGKYWVEFTDKNFNDFSVDNPDEFLSAKSIQRRLSRGIAFDQKDLPVTQLYVDSLKSLGFEVYNTSKWLNGVSVSCENSELLDLLTGLSFVKTFVAKKSIKIETHDEKSLRVVDDFFSKSKNLYDYGMAEDQITMLNGQHLHNQGYLGQGIDIAIIDAGFSNVDTISAFDSIWINNRVLGSWDFVLNQPIAFNKHSHGTNVFSIMAANLPGQFMGSAPSANYYLLRSEDGSSEYLVEEDYWLTAAEYADSVGVDIINTSLGYNTFDDNTQDHSYADMDGNTTRISRGADIACSRGILVVVSAGNSGNSAWHYITTPADADSVLTVGAVDSDRNYAAFSSTGPSADGDVKPNVTAMGLGTYHITGWGAVAFGNGTSFSAPLVCGLVACLWQANYTFSNMEIIDAIQKTSHKYNNPDSLMGYGIPNFALANFMLKQIDYDDLDSENLINVYPSPFSDNFTVEIYSPDSQIMSISMHNAMGEKVYEKLVSASFSSYNIIKVDDIAGLKSGTYILRVSTKKKTYKKKLIKT